MDQATISLRLRGKFSNNSPPPYLATLLAPRWIRNTTTSSIWTRSRALLPFITGTDKNQWSIPAKMDLLDGVDDSNASCPSVDELQIQLRAMFQTKVAETRAQHITSTFELQASALFHLVITETENDALDSLHFLENNTSLNNTGVDGLIHRSVSAMDALIHQSQDDPVLQKIIAKHIVNSINTVDGSSWTVRQVSRESQGWVFTYICKDSLQAWNRQYAKNPGRPPICECTSKEDNINQSELSSIRYFMCIVV